MGRNYQQIIDRVLPVLSTKGIHDPTLVAFGSYYLGMENPDSDVDLLILTPEVLGQGEKRKLYQKLLKQGVDAIIMSRRGMREAADPHFILSAPLECISRYGQKIYGPGGITSQMNDEDFTTGMLLRALFSLSKWQSLGTSKLITKQLGRITMILWYLEKKVALEDIFSFSHLSWFLLNGGYRELRRDEIWKFLDESGQYLSWLDSDLTNELTSEKQHEWARILGTRLKPSIPRLGRLNSQVLFSRELMDYQKSHPLYNGLKWVKVDNDKYLLKEGQFGMVVRIVSGLHKNCT